MHYTKNRFHIEHQGRYLQYTENHIYTETINLRLVTSLISSYFEKNLSCLRRRWKGCSSTLTLGFSECIRDNIKVEERQHGRRTRFIHTFKTKAYSCSEMRENENFWILSAKMVHWAGCVVSLDNSVLKVLNQ